MVDEKEVQQGSIPGALDALDYDEGMRVQDGADRIAFVTRTSDEFCVNINTESGEKWFYTEKSSRVYDLLREHLREPLRAWVY